MAKSFLGKKQRRAQSIFRPFTGQCVHPCLNTALPSPCKPRQPHACSRRYLSASLTQKWEAMQPFLQMGRRETVVFSEDSAQVSLPADAPPPPPGQQWQWCKVIPILTNDRIIFFNEAPPARPPSFSLDGCPPQTIPVLAVRMIVRLEDVTALHLSPGADDALVVAVRPAATVTYASVMEQDEASNNCRACGVQFKFFGKHRHHCRLPPPQAESPHLRCCVSLVLPW